MQIHYFQRYHGKENVVTNNTMMMLSRLYNYSSDKFFAMLNELIFETEETPEVTFNLQEAGKGSIPDAVISQKSFKIVVETKLYNQFDEAQLTNHLNSFGTEEFKVLLTLDPLPMQEKVKKRFEDTLTKYNEENRERLITPIQHCNLTFEQLVEAMKDVIDDRDRDIVAVLEDFHDYCLYEKLIPDSYRWMRAIVAGTTIGDNMDLNLYYDKASKGYTGHGYIGLYQQKSIRAIGKLVKIVTAVEQNDQLVFQVEKGEPLTLNERQRIEEAIRRSESYGYDLKTVCHRYFLADQFYPIDFRKASPYPIQKAKYFDLSDMLGTDKLPDTEEIAQILDGKTWEEFT